MTAQVFYVSSTGTGAGNSWSDASGNLRQVLENASTGSQIWVASGTYYPIHCNPCSDDERDMPFEIPDSVEVFGGFIGTETELAQRDWELNETILSGDINEDNILNNNSSTIVEFKRVSDKTILDGFTLTEGFAFTTNTSNSGRKNSGAAIYNQGELDGSISNPRISNCIFINNTAFGYGGAIYNNGGFGGNANPIFENCIFANNTSELGGGAIYNQASFSGSTLPIFSNCSFENNEAFQGNGGGIYNQGAENGNSNPFFEDCHFEGNSTSSYGGAVYCHGREGQSFITSENCTFVNNEAQFGGAVSNNGAFEGSSNSIFSDCLFENNHSTGDGGAMYNWGSDNGASNITLMNCIFRNNNSDFAGAGMFNNGINGVSNAMIVNCQFIDNVATTYGGAIYNHGKKGYASATITNCLFQNNFGSSAGAIYNLGSENGNANPRITNCTFYGNTANVGGAVYSNASDSTGTSSPIITNCIFWKNEANFGRVFRNVLGTPFIQYSAVDELECDDLNSGIGSLVSCGVGVTFNIYPEFVDTLNGDFRLRSNSPLINIGDNAAIDSLNIDFDLDHQDRIFNDTVDYGAYEYFDTYVAPSIIVQPEGVDLCEEDTLNMEVIANGTPPLYFQWYKNNAPILGAIESNISLSLVSLNDAGNYFCKIMNAVGDSIISNEVVVMVDSIILPEIQIEVTGFEICEGDSVVLNTISNGGGNVPEYIWSQNGTQLPDTLASLLLNDPSNGDEIIVQFISSEDCAEASSVFDTLILETSPFVEASIEIVGPDTIVCLGSEAKFEAFISNGGTNPQFQWLVNDMVVSGALTSVFVPFDLENGDIITCKLNSSEECILEDIVVSNEVVALIEDCSTTGSTALDRNRKIKVSPNPSRGEFYIETNDLQGFFSFYIYDLTGRVLLKQTTNIVSEKYNKKVTLLDPGIYFLVISNDLEINVKKIIISN